VRDAFAPVGVMLDFWEEKAAAGSRQTVKVTLVNDLEQPWNGPVTLRVRRGKQVLAEMKQPCRLEPLGQAVVSFGLTLPREPGLCQLEAELRGADGKRVRSLRELDLSK
jgi:hypothetical protein